MQNKLPPQLVVPRDFTAVKKLKSRMSKAIMAYSLYIGPCDKISRLEDETSFCSWDLYTSEAKHRIGLTWLDMVM